MVRAGAVSAGCKNKRQNDIREECGLKEKEECGLWMQRVGSSPASSISSWIVA